MVEGIRVEPRPPAPEPSPQDDSPDSRSRLRRALLCPYCHDDVGRKGAVLCARDGCGAVYHRDCWHECVEQYGACAVYGCESTRSRELSVRAYVARVARLLLATLLFPPQVLRALVRFEEKPLREIQGLLPQRGWRLILEQTATSSREFVQASGGGLAIAIALATTFVMVPVLNPLLAAPDTTTHRALGAWLELLQRGFLAVLLSVGLVLALVGVVALGLAVARALSLTLVSELAVLRRADLPRGTVVSRLRKGEGSKPGSP